MRGLRPVTVVVASAATVAAAGPGVNTGRRETVKVKGKDEPIEVYEILGLEGEATGQTSSAPAEAR